MEQFITVAIFTYPHEITILKHRLNMEGIVYYFENEAVTTIAPMYSNAFGGIRLKIHPSDAETVNAILKDLNDPDLMKIV